MTSTKWDSDKTISGETFSEPYRAGSEVITDPVILAVTPPFSLTPADYVYLTNSHSTWSEWAFRLVLASVAAAAPALWRQIAAIANNQQNAFQLPDYGGSILLLILAALLKVTGKLCPSPRNKVLRKMGSFHLPVGHSVIRSC